MPPYAKTLKINNSTLPTELKSSTAHKKQQLKAEVKNIMKHNQHVKASAAMKNLAALLQ